MGIGIKELIVILVIVITISILIETNMRRSDIFVNIMTKTVVLLIINRHRIHPPTLTLLFILVIKTPILLPLDSSQTLLE
jgi:hypothetical protein